MDVISKAHGKGMHTTTFARMMPLSFGGFIIDTPGIKEFGTVDMEPEEISHYFPEFRKYLLECRFNNCVHINEEGCAVKDALENLEIAPSRYINYLSIYEEVKSKRNGDMRAVIQRVANAKVAIENKADASIGKGLLVLLGIEENDNAEDIEWLSKK